MGWGTPRLGQFSPPVCLCLVGPGTEPGIDSSFLAADSTPPALEEPATSPSSVPVPGRTFSSNIRKVLGRLKLVHFFFFRDPGFRDRQVARNVLRTSAGRVMRT